MWGKKPKKVGIYAYLWGARYFVDISHNVIYLWRVFAFINASRGTFFLVF
jgi:hypothetical protein